MKKLCAFIIALRATRQIHTPTSLDVAGNRPADRRPHQTFRSIFLLLASCLSLLFAADPTFAQGTLTNGWTHTGTISPVGDSDAWTFSANVGDRIVVRIGEITQTGSFTPRIRLLNPSAVQQAVASGTVAAEISVTATNSGTFTVIADDLNGTTATGTYRLTLAKSPGTVFVAPGDEGGPLTNGVMHTGTIDVGDLDVWTFTAASGDTITAEIGETTGGSALTPALWLYGPDGRLLDSLSGAAAAQVFFRATNSGTFTLVAGDFSSGFAGSGAYRLTLAKTGAAIVTSEGDQGGPLTNGVMHTGTIDVGDLDVWNFTATNGDTITAEIGETIGGSALTPALWLYGPDGRLLDSLSGATAAQVLFRATNSGTFTIVAGDYSSGYAGSGAYRLSLAKTGDPIVVSPGDEGGPMTNGLTHTGNIDVGDADIWNFTATNGDAITVEIGETIGGSALTPVIWLYGPDGRLLDSNYGAVAAQAFFRATNSGAFTVVVGDYSSGYAGSGAYRLTLAKTGDPIVVSPGDEGGPMTNGLTHTGTIDVGDADIWNFTATNGDALTVEIGETVGGSALTPVIWLYGPDGRLLDSNYGAAAAQAFFRATNSGAFTVVVGDYSSGYAGSGAYRLTLAKTGAAIVTAPGDQGGPLTNGVTHTGNIDVGDADIWNFTATNGDALTVEIGETVGGSALTPVIWLYGPDGRLLDSNYGAAAAQVLFRATNSGIFTVVVSDFSSGYAGSGAYRLTLAKTGDPVVISAGDEGGALNGAGTYDGTIDIGDLDEFFFTACVGDVLALRMDELVNGSSLTPWLRLYGRDGTLLRSVSGATTAQISVTATNAGTFIALAGDASSGFAGTGTYRLTVNGLTSGLKLCAPVFAGTNVNLTGVGGVTNATFILFTHTNLTVPFAQWTPIATNQFDQFGVFTRTNISGRFEAYRFFRLLEP